MTVTLFLQIIAMILVFDILKSVYSALWRNYRERDEFPTQADIDRLKASGEAMKKRHEVR